MFWKRDAFPDSSYLLQLTGRIGSWASRTSNLEGLVGIGTYGVKDPGMRLGRLTWKTGRAALKTEGME